VKDGHVPLCEAIETFFRLPRELASKYARMIFLCTHRLRTLKKRLVQVSYSDFDRMATVLMSEWTDQSPKTSNVLYDRPFLEEVKVGGRELLNDGRSLELLKNSVIAQLGTSISSSGEKLVRFDRRFLAIFRSMVSIGTTLAKSKEYRDLFIDILEKVVEVFKRLEFVEAEISTTFNAILRGLGEISSQSSFMPMWRKLFSGIQECVLRMYHVNFS